MSAAAVKSAKMTVGWREWVGLPELGIGAIKAKVDTGARTSAIHAYAVERFSAGGQPRARLWVHPRQQDVHTRIICEADIVDERLVTDSGGHREKRIVIMTTVSIAGQAWSVEMTVTNRDIMRFRMLLGRTAMQGRIVVDPGRSFVHGRHGGKGKRPAARG